MKTTKQYVLLVDYRNPRKHNTAGRYRVGACSEQEAKELLREKIGFGSIQVYYEDTNCHPSLKLNQGEVKKEIIRVINNKHSAVLVEPMHACENQKEYFERNKEYFVDEE